MNEEWMQRTRLLLGDEKLEMIRRSHVLVVGLGGVGASYLFASVRLFGASRMSAPVRLFGAS